MNRKKRSDRNHVIYRITCPATGDSYIGVTVATGRAFLKSVCIRFTKHCSTAGRQTKEWTLSKFLRDNATETYELEVIEIIRGRKPAHKRERELIAALGPTLNTK